MLLSLFVLQFAVSGLSFIKISNVLYCSILTSFKGSILNSHLFILLLNVKS